MKYRIVKISDGYIVQYRFLLFWHRFREFGFCYDVKAGGWSRDIEERTYHTIKEAENIIKKDSQFPVKYKGHTIDVGRDSNNKIVYVDCKTRFIWNDMTFYKRLKSSVYEMKGAIDLEEDLKAMDKENEKKFEVVKVIDSKDTVCDTKNEKEND